MNDVFPALMEVIYMIEREIADRVVMVRADNGKGEFGPEFQSMCNKDSIIFEPYLIYKHSINRVNKRHLYITNCKARLLLFNADLLKDFQCLAIKHVIQVKNKVPTNTLPFSNSRFNIAKTLYKAYNNKVLNLANLKVFGYIVYLIL